MLDVDPKTKDHEAQSVDPRTPQLCMPIITINNPTVARSGCRLRWGFAGYYNTGQEVIQEMLQLPLPRHARTHEASAVSCGIINFVKLASFDLSEFLQLINTHQVISFLVARCVLSGLASAFSNSPIPTDSMPRVGSSKSVARFSIDSSSLVST